MRGRLRFCLLVSAAAVLTAGLVHPSLAIDVARPSAQTATLDLSAKSVPKLTETKIEPTVRDLAPLANPLSPPVAALETRPDPLSSAPALDKPAALTAPRRMPEKRPPTAKGDDRGIDPEPDVAIKPPASPAIDPPTAKPTEAAKPADGKPGAMTPADAKPAGAEEPLPALHAAIKRALDRREAVEIRGAGAGERRKRREAIAFFYAAHSFAPLWSVDGAPVAAVEPVLARLAHAADDALTLAAAPVGLAAKGTPEQVAESELALSEAVVAYAREATGSRVDPHSIAPLIGLKPKLADAAETLEGVVAAGSEAGERLRAFNPTEPRYVALRDKLMELRAAHAPTSAIPGGPDLKVGMSDPRLPLIRARFNVDGSLAGEADNLRYDTEVAAAVADFQRANGIPPSGVLTRRTIAALSGGRPPRLEGQLVANMEMWRWMPRDLGADRVEVNVPDYVVTVFRDGVESSKNRVVVGKVDTPTPLFSNAMQVVIVNPVWNVPESIIKKEMLPKLAQDPGYLDRLGYTVTERNGKLIVKQPGGAKNALGRVKFIFPNDYAVYLHDTPSKSLFASAKRAFSHGCVRVDQPFRFAESVLGGSKWPEDRLKGLLGDKERYVNLPMPLPIHIEYFTVSVDAMGHLDLRNDVYDYTRRIALALGQEG